MAPIQSTGSGPGADRAQGSPTSPAAPGASTRAAAGVSAPQEGGESPPPGTPYPKITPDQRQQIAQAGAWFRESADIFIALVRDAILPLGVQPSQLPEDRVSLLDPRAPRATKRPPSQWRRTDEGEGRETASAEERFSEEIDELAERHLDLDALLSGLGAWIDAANQGAQHERGGPASGDMTRVVVIARELLQTIRDELDEICVRYRRWVRTAQGSRAPAGD